MRPPAFIWLLVTYARRRELVVSALMASMFIAMIVFVLASLWRAAMGEHGQIAGYTIEQMVWYLAVAEAAVTAVDQRLMMRLGEELRTGQLAADLLKPVDLVWYVLGKECGRSIVRFAIILICTSLTAYLLVGPPPQWDGLALLAITGPLAGLVQTLLIVSFTASAFWLGDTNAAWFVLQKLVFLLGGMLLPLEFWPAPFDEVLALLPWAACAYTPAHLAVVDVDLPRIVLLVGAQLMWVGALLMVAVLVWSRGEKRVAVQGT